mmetsp:Transcript_9990/g.14592  ORF Transcript_9990/g.14592 Transcript_9990/m.14592 type:complete len:96 (-) Transcript_9990:11-298(-)
MANIWSYSFRVVSAKHLFSSVPKNISDNTCHRPFLLLVLNPMRIVLFLFQNILQKKSIGNSVKENLAPLTIDVIRHIIFVQMKNHFKFKAIKKIR